MIYFPKDTILQGITAKIDLPPLARQEDVYWALLESIVSQQLSVKAADTIFKRFLGIFEDNYPKAAILADIDLEVLKSVGLSRQKASYLKAVADFHISQGISYAQLAGKEDTEIIDYLTQIKGVGKWTVEMLLIFVLQRSDVFAVDDLGIQNAMKKLYNLDMAGKDLKKEMLKISERWQPYRSLACRYLWRWKDTLSQ